MSGSYIPKQDTRARAYLFTSRRRGHWLAGWLYCLFACLLVDGFTRIWEEGSWFMVQRSGLAWYVVLLRGSGRIWDLMRPGSMNSRRGWMWGNDRDSDMKRTTFRRIRKRWTSKGKERERRASDDSNEAYDVETPLLFIVCYCCLVLSCSSSCSVENASESESESEAIDTHFSCLVSYACCVMLWWK